MLRSKFHVFARKKTGFLVKGPEFNLAEDGLEAQHRNTRVRTQLTHQMIVATRHIPARKFQASLSKRSRYRESPLVD